MVPGAQRRQTPGSLARTSRPARFVKVGVVEPLAGRSSRFKAGRRDGQPSSDEEWAQDVEQALASDGVAERVFFLEFGCVDQAQYSGSFTMQQNVRLDFSEIDASAFQAGLLDQVPDGTWEISEGTGDFAGLSGGGSQLLDFTTDEVVLTGEVTSG